MFTAVASDFPSRYALGEEVYFHPGIQGFSSAQAIHYGLLARIGKVSFEEGKVTYDLAMNISHNLDKPEFYTALLVASVDSIFVASMKDLIAWENPVAVNPDAPIQEGELVQMATASGALTLPDAERITRRFIAIAADVAEQKAAK